MASGSAAEGRLVDCRCCRLGLVGAAAMWFTRGGPPDLATGEVTRGDFVEVVEVRGDVRPFRSVVVTAPYQAGELQILKIAASGTAVKKGEVVAEFDALTLRNTMQDKAGRAAPGDGRARPGARAGQERCGARSDRGAQGRVRRAARETQRWRPGDPLVVRCRADQTRDRRRRTAPQGSTGTRRRQSPIRGRRRRARDRKIAKIQSDIDIAKGGFDSLKVVAPADGTVSVMPNYRMSGPMGMPQEFREGDRAWPGAQILELPDLSSVQVTSRIDESDRGQLKAGQTSTVRAEAVPDREYHATVANISVLASVDFSSRLAAGQELRPRAGDHRYRPPAAAGHERLGADRDRQSPRHAAGAGRGGVS